QRDESRGVYRSRTYVCRDGNGVVSVSRHERVPIAWLFCRPSARAEPHFQGWRRALYLSWAATGDERAMTRGFRLQRGSRHVLEARPPAANCLFVLGMATLTACATSSPGSIGAGVAGGADAPYGSFSLSGTAFGKQTLLPTVCRSGE